ncbi:matrixin family metalloprotease [Lysobacter niastensis]|uniref:Matrixin family metalloprotease n=1 Tax=Lysobacter niastensis TaxID=380629 RepID=A0ABS0B5H0_9GAMM|nr:matrixin family metalloprotease [Lysobacter niastensis]MBF6024101.1 matrixin family metalloprotease [Lysobacter niastensis]
MNARLIVATPLTLALASALVITACKREQPATPATAEPAPAEPVAAEPAPASEPPAHSIRPATGAVPPTEESIAKVKEQIKASAAAMRQKWAGKTFEDFEATVFKEPGENGKYIVDADVAIADRKLLQEFFADMQAGLNGTAQGKLVVNQIAGEDAAPGTSDLAVMVANGRADIWNSAKKKQLRYCVSNTFAARHDAVLADMKAAARAWEEAANVAFVHVPSEDANCTASNPNVVFDVRPVNVGGQYYARAFFPNDQRAARNVLIDNSSFELPGDEALTLAGILRHELGHTLGWRHEHTRPEAGACFEDSQFDPITAYDSLSVMHYPHCNGGGDWSLMLTSKDKAGAACIYGKGSNNTESLGQCLFRLPDVTTTGSETSVSFANESVAKGAKKDYAVFAVKPNSVFQVRMSGAGPGDPDLYVRFTGVPELKRWSCRPFLSNANETCELQVPANRQTAFVQVRGYTAATYQLDVKYVKPD